MVIDNFEAFRNHLDFREKTDRYIVHILRRPKDLAGVPEMKGIGANEHQRLLRTYYIDSLEYFDRKTPAVKELCRTNRARAYVLPQVRNNFECLLSLGEKVLETIRLGNFSAKPEHLLRSAYCEYHKSRAKRWVLDLDGDCMTEYAMMSNKDVSARKWTPEEVLEFVKSRVAATGGYDPEDAFMVPTKSGHHVVTPPFDLQKAFRDCGMMYEGERKTAVARVYTGPGESELAYKNLTGWLHKDGMSLLFMDMEDAK